MPTINKYHGNYNKSNRGGTSGIKYFVVHYTGGTGSAKNNCIYFSNGNRNASADMFVDKDGAIWEYNDVASGMYTWHCGDGGGKYGITNANSVGVEVVSNGEAFTDAQIASLAYLYKYYCDKLGRKLEIVRHYDASRKQCPAPYIDANKWATLKSKIAAGGTTVTTNKPKQVPGNPVNNAGLQYRAHVQSIGWCDPVRDGQTAGTTGYGLRLEAIKITPPDGLELEVKAHIQNIGWKTYKGIKKGTSSGTGSSANDPIIGTVGESKRLEDLIINVTKNTTGKTLKYRVHRQSVGWGPWMNSGEACGSVGMSNRIEAIQMKLI